LGTLTAQRWGDMHKDVDAVWNPWQKEMFNKQAEIEKEAASISNKKKRIEYLTKYTNDWGLKVVAKAWQLSDFLWTKYDEMF
jgi:hypothetical protein